MPDPSQVISSSVWGQAVGMCLGWLEISLSTKPWLFERQGRCRRCGKYVSPSCSPLVSCSWQELWPWPELFIRKNARVWPGTPFTVGNGLWGDLQRHFKTDISAPTRCLTHQTTKKIVQGGLLKAFPRIWLLNFHSNELSLFPRMQLPHASFYSPGLSVLIKKWKEQRHD